jgi:hypothetical protein
VRDVVRRERDVVAVAGGVSDARLSVTAHEVERSAVDVGPVGEPAVRDGAVICGVRDAVWLSAVAVGGRVGVARESVCALECVGNDMVTCGVAVRVMEATLAVADEVAGENRQVTADADAEAERDADDDVAVDAERDAESDHAAVAVAPVAAAVGVVSVSRATKRTAPLPLSATRTPHARSVALQCHFAPYALLQVAVSAGPSTRPPDAADPATVVTLLLARSTLRMRVLIVSTMTSAVSSVLSAMPRA